MRFDLAIVALAVSAAAQDTTTATTAAPNVVEVQELIEEEQVLIAEEIALLNELEMTAAGVTPATAPVTIDYDDEDAGVPLTHMDGMVAMNDVEEPAAEAEVMTTTASTHHESKHQHHKSEKERERAAKTGKAEYAAEEGTEEGTGEVMSEMSVSNRAADSKTSKATYSDSDMSEMSVSNRSPLVHSKASKVTHSISASMSHPAKAAKAKSAKSKTSKSSSLSLSMSLPAKSGKRAHSMSHPAKSGKRAKTHHHHALSIDGSIKRGKAHKSQKEMEEMTTVPTEAANPEDEAAATVPAEEAAATVAPTSGLEAMSEVAPEEGPAETPADAAPPAPSDGTQPIVRTKDEVKFTGADTSGITSTKDEKFKQEVADIMLGDNKQHHNKHKEDAVHLRDGESRLGNSHGAQMVLNSARGSASAIVGGLGLIASAAVAYAMWS